jgi:hypothetical protein
MGFTVGQNQSGLASSEFGRLLITQPNDTTLAWDKARSITDDFDTGISHVRAVGGGELQFNQVQTATFDAVSRAAFQTGLQVQPLDSDLTAIAALSTTAFGRSLLTLGSAYSMLWGKALALHDNTHTIPPCVFVDDGICYFDNINGVSVDAAGRTAFQDALQIQPLDSDLTAIASLSTTAFGRSLLTLAANNAVTWERASALWDDSSGGLVRVSAANTISIENIYSVETDITSRAAFQQGLHIPTQSKMPAPFHVYGTTTLIPIIEKSIGSGFFNIEIELYVTLSNPGMGLKIACSMDSYAALTTTAIIHHTSGSFIQTPAGTTTQNGSTLNLVTISTGTTDVTMVRCSIHATIVQGVFHILAAQETPDTQLLTIHAGSFLRVTRVD